MDATTKNNLPGNLRRLRGERSQQAVAVAAGMTLGNYHLIESGKREPKAETLLRLADALGVTIDELFRG